MFLSMNWISDFVDLSGLDKIALIKNFTLATAEVEDIIVKGGDTHGVVAAKIESVEEHPSSKKATSPEDKRRERDTYRLRVRSAERSRGYACCLCPRGRYGEWP